MLVAPKTHKNSSLKIDFYKMSGAGNDFVIIDNRYHTREINLELIIKICNRKNIGCDQLIIISNPEELSSDINCLMQIFNADGSQSSTCGNATRCVAGLIFEENPKLDKILIKTSANILECFKINEKLIKVNLSQPKIINSKINLEGFDFIHIDVGNPHAISFVDNIPDDKTFFEVAPKIENNLQFFPQKTNVEFAKIINDNLIEVRVFERGVGETLACGSGACAVAVASIYQSLINNKQVNIRFKGGDLIIEFDGKNVFMTGDYQRIFSGVIDESFYQ